MSIPISWDEVKKWPANFRRKTPLTEFEHRLIGSRLQDAMDELTQVILELQASQPKRWIAKYLNRLDRAFQVRCILDDQFCRDFPHSDFRGIYYGKSRIKRRGSIEHKGPLTEADHRAFSRRIQIAREQIQLILVALQYSQQSKFRRMFVKRFERLFELRMELLGQFVQQFPEADCRGVFYGLRAFEECLRGEAPSA